MSRLPTPGSDDGQWGSILNDYLNVSLNADGTYKRDADISTALAGVQAANAISLRGVALSATAPTDGQSLTYSQSAGNWVPGTVSGSGTVSNATTTAPGLVQLSGDLAGTATSPSVAKVKGITISATAPTTGQVLAATSTSAAAWTTVSSTDSTKLAITNNLSDVSSASTARTNLGLGTAATISSTAGGDLSGTLPNPVVAKVNGIAVSGTPSTGQVLTATGTTAATWQTAASGGSGSGGFNPVFKTSAYTAVNRDFVLVNATSGAINITLPAVSAGAAVRVIKTDSSVNAVLVQSSALINGATTSPVSLNGQYYDQEYVCDGTTWYLF